MLQAGRSRVRFPVRSLNFSIDGPWVDSASNRNEYQESSCGVMGAVRLTTSPPSVSRLSRKMCETRGLTTLSPFTTIPFILYIYGIRGIHLSIMFLFFMFYLTKVPVAQYRASNSRMRMNNNKQVGSSGNVSHLYL
jgi:hypothetical protein